MSPERMVNLSGTSGQPARCRWSIRRGIFREYYPDTGVLHFTAQDVGGKSVSAEVRTEDGYLVVTITDWDYEEFLPNGTELVFYKTA